MLPRLFSGFVAFRGHRPTASPSDFSGTNSRPKASNINTRAAYSNRSAFRLQHRCTSRVICRNFSNEIHIAHKYPEPTRPWCAFDESRFQSLLSTQELGRNLLYFDQLDSTQDVIRDQGLLGGSNGTVCLAERQEKGRGRAGRGWNSAPMQNITASMLIRPKSAQNAASINFASAIAVAEAVNDFGVKAGLKWPNDVWYNGKKLCGVLTSANFVGSDVFVALGIGINVNESMKTNLHLGETATSLRDILGHEISREQLLAKVCNSLEPLIDLDMKAILDKYRRLDLLMGRVVVVMPKLREGPVLDHFEAKAVDLDPIQGNLIVELADGTTRRLSAEEVSVRPE